MRRGPRDDRLLLEIVHPLALSSMGNFTLSEPLFAIWAALVEERTGIHYRLHERELLAHKLEVAGTAAGFESALDYYYYLRYDAPSDDAFAALIDALVVNETYFFREVEQMVALCETVLLPLCRNGKRPRVWCAACATGEEPLTLAMLLDKMGLLVQVDIVATDIGEKALARAKAGVYGARALRALPMGVMGRWLEMVDGRARVSERLHERIEWRKVNLVDEQAVRALGMFDAIVCRNVLCYFSDTTIRRVVRTLSGSLNASATLLVGASESLLHFGAGLKCEERLGSFVYVRSAA
jgi:chemotaxis protein methyltransferase CheR